MTEEGGGGSGPKDILGLKFWPEGIFWVHERRRDYFGFAKKKNAGIYGYYIFHQLKSTIK